MEKVIIKYIYIYIRMYMYTHREREIYMSYVYSELNQPTVSWLHAIFLRRLDRRYQLGLTNLEESAISHGSLSVTSDESMPWVSGFKKPSSWLGVHKTKPSIITCFETTTVNL